ncbi:Two component system response regulator [uncultured Desulfobacterium sp.]|uniref:Two component system response regulator n=1 Tax=uncultured Desulfobacterium sp. TaxID=201089 RepID=A0A445MVH5_9BACT|nr:Two component system response regulator [uncultured Desulfobacterium sp.]
MEVEGTSPDRILVVEDETNVAEVMRARMESFGYEVCDIVSSGKKALSAMERCHPDIVIMDIKIKGDMDGIECAGRIRAKFDVPIIYLTSFTDEKLLQRAQATEPFGYIIKPYEAKQLHIALKMALYQHRQDRDRRKLVADLKDDLEKVKKLSGFLPICSCCKKIRNATGYWEQVEAYIKKNSEAEFTHGICPECAQKLYPEVFKNSKT